MIGKKEALFLKTKVVALVLGAILIVIVVILGLVQIFRVYNIYGVAQNRLYFYGALAISGITGLILAAWGLLKKDQK